MEFVVLAWFVLVETDSPFLVGLFGALRFFGTLPAPLYGVAVDRYNRRVLLLGSRLALSILAAIVLILSMTAQIQVWHIFVLITLVGAFRQFDNVSRQALLADIVPDDRLMNAVALSGTGREITQILGPLIGGLLLTGPGMGPAYAVILATYLTSFFWTFRIRALARKPTLPKESIWRNLVLAARFIRSQDSVLALMLMALLVNLTALTLNNGLMPVFARDVLAAGPAGLAILLGASAVGASVGSIVIASLKQLQRPGKFLLLASLGWHGALLLFSHSIWFGPSLAILLAVGAAQAFTLVSIAMLLLRLTTSDMRGRIMGVRSMVVYALPIGLLISGALADKFGAPMALAASGFLGLALTVGVAMRLKSLWSLHSESV